ncbi:hypothetical protein ACJX0J_006361 [Zea mays]
MENVTYQYTAHTLLNSTSARHKKSMWKMKCLKKPEVEVEQMLWHGLHEHHVDETAVLSRCKYTTTHLPEVIRTELGLSLLEVKFTRKEYKKEYSLFYLGPAKQENGPFGIFNNCFLGGCQFILTILRLLSKLGLWKWKKQGFKRVKVLSEFAMHIIVNISISFWDRQDKIVVIFVVFLISSIIIFPIVRHHLSFELNSTI